MEAVQSGRLAPAQDPYLEGNYAPIHTEVVAKDLEVVGELPDGLEGVFVRNASNPRFHPLGRYHFFDGDGMLHTMELGGGRATYRNRWVRTEGLAAEEEAGRALWTGIMEPPDLRRPGGPYKDTANTDVIWHAGQLLALWWLSGKARVVRLPDLETLGCQTWNGKLRRSISAHPKIDPATGEMIFFDYAMRPPYLSFGVISANGELVHQQPVELPGPRFQHDIAITPRFTLLFDMSLMWDPELLARGRSRLAFYRDKPSRIGVVPRLGRGDELRWFEVSPFFMYHVINAWEEGDEVVLIGCKIANPLAGDPGNPRAERTVPVLSKLRLEPVLQRWRLDLRTGAAKEETLDDRLTEFPRMNDAWLGRRARWSYNPRLAAAPTLLFDALVRYDLESGATRTHEYPRGWFGGEASFVPRPAAREENDGWLLTFVAEEATGASELHVLDAREIEAPPLARIRIPQRVPTGYHTRWVPAEEIARQRPL